MITVLNIIELVISTDSNLRYFIIFLLEVIYTLFLIFANYVSYSFFCHYNEFFEELPSEQNLPLINS